MADKVIETPEVPVVEEVKEKKQKNDEEVTAEEVEEVEAKEEAKENGDSEKKNGKESTNGTSETEGEKCCVKRKSSGGAGDAPDGTPAEGATPEKKAKIDEVVAEAESNGEAEVAA